MLTVAEKGHTVELPRGWHNAICHYLERWLDRDEGLRGRLGEKRRLTAHVTNDLDHKEG